MTNEARSLEVAFCEVVDIAQDTAASLAKLTLLQEQQAQRTEGIAGVLQAQTTALAALSNSLATSIAVGDKDRNAAVDSLKAHVTLVAAESAARDRRLGLMMSCMMSIAILLGSIAQAYIVRKVAATSAAPAPAPMPAHPFQGGHP